MQAKQRLEGYDLARALAIFGMVIVNYRIVMGGVSPEPGFWNWLTGLLEGRAAALFVVLAGASLSLMAAGAISQNNRQKLRQVRFRLIKRALFLLVVGLAYTPIWPADILHFYAFYLLLGVFFLTARSPTILLSAAALVLLFPILLVTLDYSAEWQWETLHYEGFWTPTGLFKHLFFNGFHPVIPWAAFLLIGLTFARTDMGQKKSRRLLGLLAGLSAVLVEISATLCEKLALEVMSAEDAAALFATGPIPPNPFYMIAAGSAAIAVIAVCFEIAEKFNRWLRPLFQTGRHALTHYVAHVVLGMALLEELQLMDDRSPLEALMAATLFFTSAVLFSWLWSKKFRQGPLEWVMRKLCG